MLDAFQRLGNHTTKLLCLDYLEIQEKKRLGCTAQVRSCQKPDLFCNHLFLNHFPISVGQERHPCGISEFHIFLYSFITTTTKKKITTSFNIPSFASKRKCEVSPSSGQFSLYHCHPFQLTCFSVSNPSGWNDKVKWGCQKLKKRYL